MRAIVAVARGRPLSLKTAALQSPAAIHAPAAGGHFWFPKGHIGASRGQRRGNILMALGPLGAAPTLQSEFPGTNEGLTKCIRALIVMRCWFASAGHHVSRLASSPGPLILSSARL